MDFFSLQCRIEYSAQWVLIMENSGSICLISLTIFILYSLQVRQLWNLRNWLVFVIQGPMTANYLATIFFRDVVIKSAPLSSKSLATLCGLPFKTQLTSYSNALQYTVHSVRNLSREISILLIIQQSPDTLILRFRVKP